VTDELPVQRRSRADGEDEEDEEDAAADGEAVTAEATPGEPPLALRAWGFELLLLELREAERIRNGHAPSLEAL
jgi:hypothetical protein